MRVYRVLIFDLFDTLFHFDRDRLPFTLVDGRGVRTTSLRAYEVVSAVYREIDFTDFYRAFVWSFEEVARLRGPEHREVSAETRFELLFNRLGIPRTPSTSALLDRALHAHMEALAGAMVLPQENRRVLEWAKGKYRLGLISNFDHYPTAYRILEDHKVKGFFETIVISDEVGFRKPGGVIFRIAFDRLGIGPGEALFIGDNFKIDIVGAKGAGMDAVWLNPRREPPPEGAIPPDFTVQTLEELIPLLKGG